MGRATRVLTGFIVGFFVTLSCFHLACAKPPIEKVTAAQEKAQTILREGTTDQHFNDLVKALTDELALQDQRFFKTYKRTSDICDDIMNYTPQGTYALEPQYRFDYCPYCGKRLPKG